MASSGGGGAAAAAVGFSESDVRVARNGRLRATKS